MCRSYYNITNLWVFTKKKHGEEKSSYLLAVSFHRLEFLGSHKLDLRISLYSLSLNYSPVGGWVVISFCFFYFVLSQNS